MKISNFNIALLFLFVFLTMQSAAQTQGILDPSFGKDGISSYHWKGLSYFIWDAKIQPDGKMLLVSGDCILRLTANGAIDNSFSGGVIKADNGRIIRMALQADGKILVTGYVTGSDNIDWLNMRRLMPDGSPDLSFGTASLVSNIRSNAWFSFPLVQPDGKIVVITTRNEADYVLVRFNSDGSSDSSFGQGGTMVIPVSPQGQYIVPPYIHAKLEADGSILIASSVAPPLSFSPTQYDLIKIKPNGGLDLTFGSFGIAHPQPVFGHMSSVEFLPDGKIIIGGMHHGISGPIKPVFIMRLLPDGNLDESFFAGTGFYYGTDGVSGYLNPENTRLVRQSDGKLLMAFGCLSGNLLSAGPVTLFRFDADGYFDPGFGTNGIATIDYISTPIHQAIPLPGNKILVAGVFQMSTIDQGGSNFGFRYTGKYFQPEMFVARILTDESISTNDASAVPAAFQLEPNPCRSASTLRCRDLAQGAANLKVFDQQGRLIVSETLANPCDWRLNTSHWAPGLYSVELQQQQQKWTQQLVKVE